MESTISPKKVKSTIFDNINTKTSITCSNVPDGLFETTTAKKHFSKFGRVQKIKFFPKRQMCIVEYEQFAGVEQALLNAGAFDGFMFDVTRTNARIRRKSKKDDDPDWLPDPGVEEELSAMRGGPTYRIPRQKAMEIDPGVRNFKVPPQRIAKPPVRKATPVIKVKQTLNTPSSAAEPPALITAASTNLTTSEAAVELHQLRSRVSLTPDEQWRTLDARDRILRAWGGAGSRVKEGGATIGTCPDMCPEKELLHRQAEHQVMTLETVPDSDGQLEPWRAVKQYSRSSADQEIPMCYELRPAHVLTKTCSYLLNEIADTTRQVTLADWFHFMWDRFRGIRKDITQQALCCADSIRLVEVCARFHAHCAARLADLEHTQFDQKLNTDNLTKCLQTLKHMYADVRPEWKPREAEFRGYIALLNLGDSNFLWEIKQLPLEVQKSASIVFAIQIFTAIDNNNYVRFFRLIKERATYLQACILLRYFNDVRARALARIVKAYAPRGGSRYPAEDIMNALAFESIESMKSFINHYGLRLSNIDSELSVILDRNQFIEDSDPYPCSRAVKLIESKRQGSVGEVIAGGPVPKHDRNKHILHSSFNNNGKLKETALLAEDLGYNTINDSNKDIKKLKKEIQKLGSGSRIHDNAEIGKDVKKTVSADLVIEAPNKSLFASHAKDKTSNKTFSFQPAVPVASSEILKTLPINNTRTVFKFSKPHQETIDFNIANNLSANTSGPGSVFKESKNHLFKNVFAEKSAFMSPDNKNKDVFSSGDANKNLFLSNQTNVFNEKDSDHKEGHKIFNGANNFPKIFNSDAGLVNTPKSSGLGNIFGKDSGVNIFKSFPKPSQSSKSIFATSEKPITNVPIFTTIADSKVSSTSLFKNACQTERMFPYFPSKNREPTIADNIFNSVQKCKDVYEFQEEDNSIKLMSDEQAKEAASMLQEKKEQEEENKLKMQQEHARRKKDELKKVELQKLEEIRLKEEIKMKKQEEERMLKRKAEDEKLFKEKVMKDAQTLLANLVEEISDETVKNFVQVEVNKFQQLLSYSQTISEELLNELIHKVIISEIQAHMFCRKRLMKKWFYIWKKQYLRNKKRRSLLEDTPVWITEYTPIEEARFLKRVVEDSALKNMNAIHRGYTFTGELNQTPLPEPYNVMDIIKSSLLKRMRLINYPYDKCFFWKVALVSPGPAYWIYKKINIQNWLLHVLGDKHKLDQKDGLIQIGKYSWNQLMNFAISIGLTNRESISSQTEVIEGANGIMFYFNENYTNSLKTIEEIMKCKYPYQIVPIAVIIPKLEQTSIKVIEEHLDILISNNAISCYKVFVIKSQNLNESLNLCTKNAMKWLAKKYPKSPPIEIDYLKSICERYLGYEIWHKLRSETDSRVVAIQKDLKKLVNCYNEAVDKLSKVLTNENVFNYPQFPLEFNQYLDHSCSYPKPYEFIPSCTKQKENMFEIKLLMQQLKLVTPTFDFQPSNAINMQQQIQCYCSQIGCFEDPQKVACKVVAVLPKDFFNIKMPLGFKQFYEQYNLIDFLNIIVYEKINNLHYFNSRFAIYEKTSLEEYRNIHWLYDTDIVSGMKHKILDHEDSLDLFISVKRRKLENSEIEYLTLEDKDFTIVEDNIAAAEEEITLLNGCMETVVQLEKQLDDEKKKSNELENLLRVALNDV